jgi:hypothetical protein
MLNKKYSASSVLLAGAMCLPLSAHATQPGPYLGIGVGSADDVILNENAAAAKFFAGINVNRFLGLEVSYVNLGDYVNGAITQDGVAYELVGYLPVSPYVDIFGKVGMFNWTVSSNYSYASAQGTNNDYGFGISAAVSPRVWLRGEYQKFMDVDGGDVNLASVSISYHF